MELTFRTAYLDDCASIAACMRQGDRLEVAAVGQSPLEALQESLADSSVAYTALVDGQPAAMFGLIPPLSLIDYERAGVWMLTGTPVINISPITFVRVSRQIIARFLDCYPILQNWVDARYTASIRWLGLCGARFSATRTFEPEHREFWHFEIRRPE